MKVVPIIDKLKQLPGMGAGLRPKSIGGALEFAGLQRIPNALPALFVVPDDEDANASARAGVIDQLVNTSFVVVLILSAARADPKIVSDELEEWEQAIKHLLVGWVHPDMARETQYANARTLSVDGTSITRGLRFRSSYHLRKQA